MLLLDWLKGHPHPLDMIHVVYDNETLSNVSALMFWPFAPQLFFSAFMCFSNYGVCTYNMSIFHNYNWTKYASVFMYIKLFSAGGRVLL